VRAALLAAIVAIAWTSPADADRAKKKHRAAKKSRKAAPAPAPDPVVPPVDPQVELQPDPPALPGASAATPSPATGAATPDPAPSTGGAAAGAAAATTDAEAPLTGTADLSTAKQAPAAPKREAPTRRFRIRAGVAHVKPLAQSRELELADIDGAASLAVENGPIAGSGARVGSATIPALIIGYQLPWLDGHLALETVLGLPFTVKFEATGTLANQSIAPMALGIPTGVKALGPQLGEAKAAPPLVTAVYTFNHREMLRPFVGGGVAVLYAYDAKVTNPTLIEVSQPEFTVSPAPGLVLHGGLEARITDRIFARLDVKFIAFMMARGEVHHIQVRTPELPLFDTVEVGTAKMNVWVNPLIVQAGVGTDF
jgi:outer membrane protein W